MANKHMKRCSTSFIIREMQVKTTMRYHLIVIRMVIIKKFTNKKCWRGCGVKGNLLNCCWNENWYSHYGEHYGDSIKTKNKSTIWPRNPTTGHKPWENHIGKRHMFITALFTITRTWKQPWCPLTDEWIRKLWYTYTMEYYSAIKRKHLSQF